MGNRYLLPDFPENTRWFSPEERRLAQVRLAEEAGEADEDAPTDSAWTGLALACKDPKVWLFSLYTCTQLIGLSFLAFFPTLTSTLGFNSTVSLLLAAPPWLLATVITCFNALHADKTGERFFHNTVPFWGVVVGYIIGVTTVSVAGRYVALFFMACGFAGSALTLVWVANTASRPPAKRAAAIAIVNGVGNIGSLIGSFVWKAQWGPDYHPSMYIGIAMFGLTIMLAIG
ncbi:major facilitator superfamily domain-containing protein, partial [Amylostereum chailletii]